LKASQKKNNVFIWQINTHGIFRFSKKNNERNKWLDHLNIYQKRVIVAMVTSSRRGHSLSITTYTTGFSEIWKY